MFGTSLPSSSSPFGGENPTQIPARKYQGRKIKQHGSSLQDHGKNGQVPTKCTKRMVPKLSKEQDSFIGSLFTSDPSSYGFYPSSYSVDRELPRYLIRQAPILKPVPYLQDEWDKDNQEKMQQLEDSISDVTTLWETFKKMREVEREVMEKKGLVDKADQAKDLTDAITFQGTCQDMCPIFERARRSVENNVVRYEKANPSDKKVSRDRALKVFARPAAAAAPPLPSDVRPPHILVRTLDYIVDNIVPLLPECESFLWDRMRSIRQDFTYQNYSGPEAIDCNERIVRIHLLILHQMAKSDLAFSIQQELEQLHKALITLCEIYDEIREQGGQSPNEPEFRAYALLSKIRDPEYDKMIQDLPYHIFNDDLVQLAITFRRILANSNHVERGVIVTENCMNLYDRFFQLIQAEKVPFLMASFLQVYLNEIRFYGFKSLSLAVTKKGGNLPFQYFVEHFLFRDEQDLKTFCDYYSVDVEDGKIILKSLTGVSHFLPETQPMKKNWLHCVELKLRNKNTTDLINIRKANVDTIPSDNNAILDEVNDTKSNSFSSIKSNKKTSTINEYIPTHVFAVSDANTSRAQISDPSQVEISGWGQTESTPQPYGFNTPANANNEKKNYLNNTLINKNNQNEQSKNNEIQRKLLEQKQLQRQQLELATREREELNRKEQEEKIKLEIQKRKDLEIQKQVSIKKNGLIEDIASQLLNQMLKKKAEEIINLELDSKEKLNRDLKMLTDNLYRSFVHEQIFFIYQEVSGDIFRRRKLLTKTLCCWKGKLLRLKKEKEKKILKQQDVLRITNELGIGKRISPHFINETLKPKSIDSFSFENSSFLKPSHNYDTPLAIEGNHFTTPIRNNTSIWAPLNLKEIYLDRILSKYRAKFTDDCDQNLDMVKMDAVIFSRDWTCVSGEWILSKFSLKTNSKFSLSNSKCQASFIKLNNEYNVDDFHNVNLVIFNTGVTDSDIFDLDMRLQQDGEKLIELICGVSFNTNFKFELMLIYWESIENPKSTNEIKNSLRIDKILKRFSKIIYKINVVKIVGNNPELILIDALKGSADGYQFELTDRGIYNQMRKQKSVGDIENANSRLENNREYSTDIDEKMQQMLDSSRIQQYSNVKNKSAYAHLKNHVMASPRARYKKLPVLLSDSHKSKYKTPKPISSSCQSSINPAELSNPSHLLKKIKPSNESISAIATSNLFGTPSQSRHLMNHKTMLTTPQLAGIESSHNSAISNNSSVPLQSEFVTPVTSRTITAFPHRQLDLATASEKHTKSNQTNTGTSNDSQLETPEPELVPTSIRDLQNLIASVKRNLNDRK